MNLIEKKLSFFSILFLFLCATNIHGAIDTLLIKQLLTKGIVASNKNKPKEALPPLQEALSLSQKQNYTYGLFKSYLSLGYHYYNTEPVKADSLMDLAIPFAQQLPDKLEYANIFLAKGNLQWYRNNLSGAIANYLKCKLVYDSLKDNKNLGVLHMNIAAVYYSDNQFEMALGNFEQAAHHTKLAKDSGTLINILLGITSTHASLKSPIDTLEFFLLEARKLSQTLGMKEYEVGVLVKLGNLEVERNEPEKAILLASQALTMAKELRSKTDQADALLVLSDASRMSGKLSQSLQYSTTLKEISDQNYLTAYKYDYAITRSKTLYALGRYKESHDLYKRATLAKDSQINLEKTGQIQELETKYKVAENQKLLLQEQIKNERSTKDLRKKNQALLVSILVGLAVLFILILSYRNFRNKQRLKEKELATLSQEYELKVLESVIEGEEKERERMARELHDGISGSLAGIKLKLNEIKKSEPKDLAENVQHVSDLISSTAAEVRTVSHNLMPQNLIAKGLVKSITDLCERINQSGALAIDFQALNMQKELPNGIALSVFRITQEIVNNILKHANAKNAIIQLSVHQQTLLLTAEDDGDGFNAKEKQEGIGISSMRSRIHSLNGSLDIDSGSELGTSITVEIQLRR